MGTTRDYEVTVSATLGRSMGAVLGSWVADAHRAKAQIDGILGASIKVPRRAGGKDPRVSEAEKASKELEKIREREIKDVEKQANAEARAHERAVAKVAAIKERFHREEQRREDQADSARQKRNEAIVSGSFGNMRKVAGVATRVGGELTSGFGVNFDLSSAMQRGAGLEKQAVDIVNAGNRGDGSAASRDAQAVALQEQGRSIGDKYKIDPSKVLAGLAQFQAKTGDTETASAGLDRFAKLAKAFNVELNDMISAAGEVSSKLEDSFTPGEKRAQKTYEVLKKLTAQGQEGAIEIAELAKEMSRIGGGAGFFKGDIGDTMGKLGALAQLARQTGGANTAADASRAVAVFVTTLKTPARRQALDRYGVEYKDKDGSFLDPNTIIKNALLKTGGNTEKMNDIFKSSLGTKPVDALAKEFKAGGGGKGGIANVDKLLAKFGGSVGEETINENVARANNTRESKAQAFQNNVDKVADSLATRVLPAFEQMAPVALDVAKGLSSIVAVAAEHPVAAIMTAIAGSIAKAAIGETAGKALGTALAGMGGKGLAIGALTATAVTAYLYLRKTFDEGHEGQTEGLKGQVAAGEAAGLARDVAAGRVSKEEALKKLEETYSVGSKQLKMAEKGVGYLDALNPFSDVTAKDAGAAQELQSGNEQGAARIDGKTSMEVLKSDLASVKEAIDALKTQMAADAKTTKKVEVVNQPGTSPSAPTNGTVNH